MKAKFDNSVCGLCKKKILKGEEIENKLNNWVHSKCIEEKPATKPKKEKPAEKKPDEPGKTKEFVKIDGPSTEAEILVRYHLDRAHKIVYENIEDIHTLSKDDQYSCRVKEGMITKILVDADLKLREINRIKSEYKN